MRTVELLLDADLDTAVRGLWRRLADAGLPSLADHQHRTNRPHLTLSEAQHLDVPALRQALRRSLPLPISPAHLGVFTSERHPRAVLHVALVPTPALVALHSHVHELLLQAGAAPAAHLPPGRWSPHVTLSLRLPVSQLATAVALLADWRDTAGWLVGARTYDSGERAVEALTEGDDYRPP